MPVLYDDVGVPPAATADTDTLVTDWPAAPSEPSEPLEPLEPEAPVAPVGIPKLNVAALDDPALATVALAPALNVVTLPTAIVAAAPDAPVLPVFPVEPEAPVSPRGIVKLNVAADDDPAFTIATEDPALPVVTLPTAIVAAAPAAPVAPVTELPCAP